MGALPLAPTKGSVRVSWVAGFVCHPRLAAKYQPSPVFGVRGSSVFKSTINLPFAKNQQEETN